MKYVNSSHQNATHVRMFGPDGNFEYQARTASASGRNWTEPRRTGSKASSTERSGYSFPTAWASLLSSSARTSSSTWRSPRHE